MPLAFTQEDFLVLIVFVHFESGNYRHILIHQQMPQKSKHAIFPQTLMALQVPLVCLNFSDIKEKI